KQNSWVASVPSTDQTHGAVSHSIPEWIPETIVIPNRAHRRSVDGLGISVRLRKILATAEIHLIGQLHGRTYTQFSRLRRCGLGTIAELRNLVRHLQSPRAHIPLPASGGMGSLK